MYGASFIQAARGPVMLITLGILLAIHQNTAWGFEQTFPVLIIVFGILKLLERSADKSDGPMQQPPQFPQTGGQV